MPSFKQILSFTALALLFSNQAFTQCRGTNGFTTSSPLCINQVITFTDTTTPSPAADSVVWVYKNTRTKASSITKTYTSTVTNDTVWMYRYFSSPSCVDSSFKRYSVFALPTASFTFSPDSACSLTAVNFTNASTGTGLSSSWNFGNSSSTSNTSLLTNPSHKFDTVGTRKKVSYTTTLTVTDAYGCKSTTTKTVLVRTRPDATLEDQGFNNFAQCSRDTVFALLVKNISTSKTTDKLYEITWGNNSSATFNNGFDTITHNYIGFGYYTLTLTVTDSVGCKSTKVYNPYNGSNPASNLGNLGTTDGCAPHTITFTIDTSSATGLRKNTTGTKYTLLFTDGTPPISYDTTTYPSTYVKTFTKSSCGSNSVSYNNSFQATLIAENGCGPNPAILPRILISEKPKAGFTKDKDSACLNDIVKFTDTSTAGNSIKNTFTCDNTKRLIWRISPNTGWTISSGDTGTQTNYGSSSNWGSNTLSIKFTDTGLFTIKLVTGNTTNNTSQGLCGNDTAIRTIRIHKKPVAGFKFNNPGGGNICAPVTLNMVDTSKGVHRSYLWTINPNTGFSYSSGSSTTANPSILFSGGGAFTIQQKVSNYCGSDTASKNINIKGKPSVTLPAPKTYCEPKTITFNPAASDTAHKPVYTTNNGDTLRYKWKVTGGSYTFVGGDSISSSTTVKFNSSGSFKVQIIFSNECSSDTAIQTIFINPLPIPKISVNDSSQCLNTNSFTFIDSSSIASGSISTRLWTFGNSTTASTVSHNISYSSAGSYTVKLVLTSNLGCKDSTTKNVTVYNNPSVSFSVNDTDQCVNGNVFNFTNNSSISTGTLTYLWKFSSTASDTSSIKNPTKTYTSVGTYSVKLLAISDKGCKDSITKQVIVFAKPVALFSVNDTDQCGNSNLFTFTNSSTISSGSLNYLWRFSSTTSDTSNQQNPSKSYASAGTYAVKLIATSNNGCKDSITKNVYIFPKGNPIFTVNDSDQCFKGNKFDFTNTSTVSSGSLTYKWLFSTSTGDTSNQTSPSKTYNTYGNYVVRLITTTDKGCKDTLAKTMYVYPEPIARISITDSMQCINGNHFLFRDTSTIPSGYSINQWSWSFGDNSTSTNQHPQKTYTTVDTFLVRLIATTANGCKDTAFKNVYVFPTPVPVFSINDTFQCLRGNLFTLTNSSSITSGTLNYLWKFSSIANDTSSQANPTKQYSAGNTYQIKLIVTSNRGCKDSLTKQVIVNPNIAGNKIKTPQSICAGAQPQKLISDSTIIGGNNTYSYQWQSSTDSISWNNVSGATSTDYQPNSLSVTTWYRRIIASGDCADTSNKIKITVTTGINNNTISSAQSGCTNFTPNKLTGTTPSGGISTFTYQWESSNDSITWNVITSANDSSYQPGTLSNTIYYRRNVTSGTCTSISNFIKIGIYPKVTASFTAPNACYGFAINFASTSTVTGSTISQYRWTFSDTTTSSASSLAKSFTYSGQFTAKLVVTTTDGCKDSLAKTIYVLPKPVAKFSFRDTCKSNPIAFSADSSSVASGSITAYNWTFGDNTSNTGKNINKAYTAAGSYTTKLIVTTDSLCKDSISKTVVVFPVPVAVFSVNDSGQCERGHKFEFTNSSSISAGTLSYKWLFSSSAADTSNVISPSKVYSNYGNRSVRLIAISDKGCRDTAYKNVYVWPEPIARIGITDSMQCINGNNFLFRDTSAIPSGYSINQWSWNFGDNSTSTNQHPQKNYTTTDTFLVRLIVTTFNGCKDTTFKNVYVFPKPTPTFSINDTFQCLRGNSFVFTNSSSISSGTLNYLWMFSSIVNDTSIQANPTKQYSAGNTYQVKLMTTSNRGCKDSLTKQVIVNPNIGGNKIKTPQSICAGAQPQKLISDSTVIGGNNTYNYQWQSSTDSISWSNVSGATSSDYLPPSLSITTWYRRIIASGDCSDTSNIVKVVVTPGVTNNSITAPQANCQGFTPSKLTGTIPIGGTSSFNYQWESSSDSITWSTIQSATDSTYQPTSLSSTIYYRRKVGSGSCINTSNFVKITIYPRAIVSFTAPNVCYGFAINFTSTSTITGGTITQNNWAFSDATIASGSSVAKSFSTYGQYTAKLLVTTADGCKDSLTKTVYVHPKPVAKFSYRDTCKNDPIAFSADSSSVASGSITAYDWTFGDNTSNTGKNVNKTYTAAGSYTTKMIVTTDSLCKDSISKTVIVFPIPVSAFTINDSTQCQIGHQFNFNNTSSIASGTLSYKWLFSSSLTDTTSIVSPSKVYSSYGNRAVRLIAISDKGCRDTTLKNVYVWPEPIARIGITDSMQCINGNNFLFRDTSTLASGYSINQWNWNFGDNGTSTNQHPQKTYTTTDTFLVRLIVITSNGCKDTAFKTVYVFPKPTPAFSINDTFQCLKGNLFTFTNSSSISSGTLNYLWKFSGTTNDTSTQISPNKQYSVGNTYAIKLVAISDRSCRDSLTKQVVVNPNIGGNKIKLSQTICAGAQPQKLEGDSTIMGGNGSYNYQWQSSTDSISWSNVSGATSSDYLPPSLSITTWYRRIIASGDCADTTNSIKITVTPGVTNNSIAAPQIICYGQTPQPLTGSQPAGGIGGFTYLWEQSSNSSTWSAANGINTGSGYAPSSLTDTVYYRRKVFSGACISTSNIIKIAVKPLPVVNFSASYSCFPDTTIFTDSTTINQGGLVNYIWFFGDSTSSTLTNPIKYFSSANSYSVKLIVVSNFGCVDSTIKTVSVHPKPIAGFASTKICYPLSTDFTDTSKVSTGTIAQWLYDFGDGNNATIQNPSHPYTSFASYVVQQIVITDKGCKDTATATIKVKAKPNPAFSASSACLKDSTKFINSSGIGEGSIINYLWDFGNGKTSIVKTPSVLFTSAGTYPVKLITVSDSGCVDSLIKNIVVNPLPTINFTIDTLGCVGATNTFTNTTVGAVTYTWDFGDTTFSSATTGIKTYTKAGTYKVQLKGFTSLGCYDSLIQTIRIIEPPTAEFEIQPDSGCAPLIVKFTNKSFGEYVTYNWFFGNGLTNSTHSPPDVTYTQSLYQDTVYYIRLTVSNKCGATTATDSVLVIPFPIANFATDIDSGCSKLPISIINLSKGRPTSFIWDFGDSSPITTVKNPISHTFTTDSTTSVYKIKLIAINQCGRDSMIKPITVFPNTVRSFFNVNTNRGCEPLDVVITDYSLGASVISYDFGNGHTSSTPNIIERFDTAGTYTIHQYVTNGCSFDTSSIIITVLPTPKVTFNYNKPAACINEPIEFINTTANAAGIKWNFNNEDTSILNTVSYQFKTQGIKNVTLYVTSFTNGCVGNKTDTVRINPLPIPKLYADSSYGCPGLTVNFIDSSINGFFREWKFGNGDVSNKKVTSSTFNDSGVFTVKLISTSQLGCKDSITTQVKIYPKPFADFSLSDTAACAIPFNMEFINASQRAIDYLWDFGDGNSSTATNPIHTYTAYNRYNVSLRAENLYRCFDTANTAFTIYPTPAPNFTTDTTDGCQPLTITFINNTAIGTKYSWYFGNTDSIVKTDTSFFQYTYKDSGIFNVKLVAFNGPCADSLTRFNNIKVFPKPKADFDTIVNSPKSGDVQFINQSKLSNRYLWDFGDFPKIKDTTSNPFHRFYYPGNFEVLLIVFTDKNCADTALKTVFIKQFGSLFVPNAFAPLDGIGGERIFKPSGTGIASYHIQVFNMNGELMWEDTELLNTQPANGWDGFYNGQVCPQGTYIWKVNAQFIDGTTWHYKRTVFGGTDNRGNVTLIR